MHPITHLFWDKWLPLFIPQISGLDRIATLKMILLPELLYYPIYFCIYYGQSCKHTVPEVLRHNSGSEVFKKVLFHAKTQKGAGILHIINYCRALQIFLPTSYHAPSNTLLWTSIEAYWLYLLWWTWFQGLLLVYTSISPVQCLKTHKKKLELYSGRLLLPPTPFYLTPGYKEPCRLFW